RGGRTVGPGREGPTMTEPAVQEPGVPDQEPLPTPPQIDRIDLTLPMEVIPHPRFERPLQVTAREAALLRQAPWVRSLGKLTLEVSTQGWRFPTPPDQLLAEPKPRLRPAEGTEALELPTEPLLGPDGEPRRTRI